MCLQLGLSQLLRKQLHKFKILQSPCPLLLCQQLLLQWETWQKAMCTHASAISIHISYWKRTSFGIANYQVPWDITGFCFKLFEQG